MAGIGGGGICGGCSKDTAVELGDEPHVLAVDDNLIDRKLVEKLLKNSSCKVTTAENGLRALEYLGLGNDQRNNLDGTVLKVNLIITDYCMPGVTGYEQLEKIKVLKSWQNQQLICYPFAGLIVRHCKKTII